MKSDWHRYNLKRRVAGLPCIEEAIFNAKVQQLSQAEEDDKKAVEEKASQVTKKEQRRKEKEALLEQKRELLAMAKRNMTRRGTTEPETQQDAQPEPTHKNVEEITKELEQLDIKETEPKAETPEGETAGTELTEEQLAEQLMAEKLAKSVEISPETCLFCDKRFPYFEACCTHMFKYHGFYVPEPTYLTDKVGLVKYMSEKIGVGNVCIVCNYQGKSVEAVRAHMLAKKHCSIPFESENEKLEISEFYDFSSTYKDLDEVEGEWEDEGSVVSDDGETTEELPQQVLYDDGVELHLPSGVKVGHRSLNRYFRQSLKPEQILTEGQGTVIAAESRHLAQAVDRQAFLEKSRTWRTEKKHQDRDDRRMKKFINQQTHFRDELLQ